jgi:hypothetical protein
MNYQIAQPLDIDHMPAEVATEMLASPRAKLTARQRKTCMAARQRVFATESGAPLRRRILSRPIMERKANRHLFRHGVKTGLFFDETFSPVTTEQKLDNKFRAMPIAKLATLRRRAIRNRARVQYAYAKLAGDESKKAVQLRRLLDLAATHHEAVQDSAQSIVNARLKRANAD